MPEFNVRYGLRLLGNRLMAAVPPPILGFILRSFDLRQDLAEAAGYNVIPRVFWTPVPLRHEIDLDQLDFRRDLPGINLNEDDGLRLLEAISGYAAELDDVPYALEAGAPFWFDNGSFTDFDASSLYAMLRHLKPKRYIELGCGFSSFMSSRALSRNAADGTSCDAVFADPEPRRDMANIFATGKLIKSRVQDLPMDLFTRLESGDVLFIDTSHVLKFQSDVEHEILRILPSLKPGVWIHFHDVFTPYDYPRDWVTTPLPMLCNEQYVMEALLSGGERYRVELPLFLFWKEQFSTIQKLLLRGKTRPQGFWIRKVG